MTQPVTLLCLLMLLSPAQEARVDTSIVHLKGELQRKTDDGFEPVDDFHLVQVIDRKSKRTLFAVLQSGTPRDGWPMCVGMLAPNTEVEARIHHVHDGVPYRIAPAALRFDRKLSPGNVWTDGRRTYRVGEPVRHKDIDCVEVFMAEGPARRHKMLVATATGRVISLDQRVFMGQGDEFKLILEKTDPLGFEKAQLQSDPLLMQRVLKLQKSLTGKSGQPAAEFSREQVALVTRALPSLKEVARSPWAKKLVSRIESDLVEQKKRAFRLADLRKAALGKQLPGFASQRVKGGDFKFQMLAGKVTVLHFWMYRDEPMTDPYGQTAYLDFLANRFAGKPVAIVGLNVDTRYSSAQTARTADRSAGKFVDFMNLSFPVLRDDGSIIRKFGDPRAASGELPLWIVVDRQGRIVEWHSGYYDVDPRRGLIKLHDVVNGLLK